MTSIRSVLRHRADVRRPTTTNVNGQPVTTYVTIKTGVPVLLDTQGFETIASSVATVAQTTESRKFGNVFVAANADVKPADRLAIKVPGRPTANYEVQPEPSWIDTPTGVSHREIRVKSVP